MTVFAAYIHTDEKVTKAVLPHADLVVTAVPREANYKLASRLVKPKAAVIAIEPSNIDEEKLMEKCSLLTKTSDGIGRVTTAITFRNLYNLVMVQRNYGRG
jgi:5,10-methylene-tetrahydrofolate dehydrogenase/methenyl tetrahydrofolate cyclohydrolase